jgi:hypothetical protein
MLEAGRGAKVNPQWGYLSAVIARTDSALKVRFGMVWQTNTRYLARTRASPSGRKLWQYIKELFLLFVVWFILLMIVGIAGGIWPATVGPLVVPVNILITGLTIGLWVWGTIAHRRTLQRIRNGSGDWDFSGYFSDDDDVPASSEPKPFVTNVTFEEVQGHYEATVTLSDGRTSTCSGHSKKAAAERATNAAMHLPSWLR